MLVIKFIIKYKCLQGTYNLGGERGHKLTRYQKILDVELGEIEKRISRTGAWKIK